jgi:hypothetical protein
MAAKQLVDRVIDLECLVAALTETLRAHMLEEKPKQKVNGLKVRKCGKWVDADA